MNSKKKKYNCCLINTIAKKRFVNLTYGLIYPALLGSIMFDIFYQDNFSYHTLTTSTFWIKILIVMFYCIDYIHLYSDLGTLNNLKSLMTLRNLKWLYILCDFAVSFLFFFSFLFFKIENYRACLLTIAIIPCAFYFYKSQMKVDTLYFFLYTFLSSIVAGMLLFLMIDQNVTWQIMELGFFIAVEFIIYLYSILYIYNKKEGCYRAFEKKTKDLF